MREVIIAKNKEGETGSFAIDFDGRRQKFFESLRACEILKASRKGKGGYAFVGLKADVSASAYACYFA